MPTIWVDDGIKAKLIELRFRCYMPAKNHSKYDKICDMDSYNKQTSESTNF